MPLYQFIYLFLVVILSYGLSTIMMRLGLNKRTYNYVPGECAFSGSFDEGVADFDVSFDASVIAATGYNWTNMSIAEGKVFSFNADNSTAWQMTKKNNDMNPSGISVSNEAGTTHVLLVNHKSKSDTVEMFSSTDSRSVLKHLRTVRSKKFHGLRDVVFIDKKRFYVTVDSSSPNIYINLLQRLFMLSSGSVIFYNGHNTTVAANVPSATGIVHDSFRRMLFVASASDESIHVFRVRNDYELVKIKEVPLGCSPQNLWRDIDGSLIVTCHPILIRQYLFNFDQKNLSPSQVLRVTIERDLSKDATISQLYSNDGAMVSAASSAVRSGHRLLIGSRKGLLIKIGELSDSTYAGGKRHAHRRSSSQWVPTSPPLPNPITLIRLRNNRCDGSRVIRPNFLSEEPRHSLYNYHSFKNNEITTTKYNIVTFIPKNIVHQMRTKYANLYFLLIAIVNFVPIIAAFNPIIALIPITFVLGTTLIKDGWEDFRRWRFDSQINSRLGRVWDREHGRFRNIKWKYMLVGDIVHVSNNEEIPADMLLLRSSDETGNCFVETLNLDGETSLKQRSVPMRYLHFSGEESGFTPDQYKGIVHCTTPDKEIYNINAKIEVEPGHFEAITKDNMLLRGSKLKNTTFVEGIIVYAVAGSEVCMKYGESYTINSGHDTKVMLNNGRAPHKISLIELQTNRFIIYCLILLAAMVVLGAVMSGLWTSDHPQTYPYIAPTSLPPVIDGLVSVLSFLICYQVLVPISLYITVELIKIAQMYFVMQDIEMYDEESDRKVDCRTWNIPEELGQVSHILSDKTGTLTENSMIFRNCAVDDRDYGGEFEPTALDPKNPVLSPGLKLRLDQDFRTNANLRHFMYNLMINNSVVVSKAHNDAIEVGVFENGKHPVYTIANSCFYDISLVEFNAMIESTKNEQMPQIRMEMRSNSDFSLIPEEVEQNSTVSPTSPTRTAFPVPDDDSASSGVVSRVSSISRSVVKTFRRKVITPISNIPSMFPSRDAAARRFTINPRERCPYEAESPDELALLLGARLYDFTIEERTPRRVKIVEPSGRHKKFSVLLTLPFDAKRKRMSVIVETNRGPLLYCKGADSAILKRLTPPDEEESNRIGDLNRLLYNYACRGLRTLCFSMKYLDREQFIDFKTSYEFIKQDTSEQREDMLSDKADEIEKDMKLLGITGVEDRLQDGVPETIESLREAGIQIWVLTGDKLETAENIARSAGLFEAGRKVEILQQLEQVDVIAEMDAIDFNLILSGSLVKFINAANPRFQNIMKVLKRARCVLCYRMTPAEKADVVRIVKNDLQGRVLSIGDGANDVPMIQAAHVGIGIAGKEGMQAVMACDFAIARFRFLKRLLLVHGHWCYHRLALSFLYFLYKNTFMVFVLFYYQFYDGYTGTYSQDPTYSLLFPIVFTAVQPIVVGVLDQDEPAEVLMDKPILYEAGIKGTLYGTGLFAINVIDGIWQSFVVYYISHMVLHGSNADLWTLGFYLSNGMMFTNCFHLAIEIRCWSVPLIIVFIFFFGVHFGYFLLESYFSGPAFEFGALNAPVSVATVAMSTSLFWLSLLAMTVIALYPRYITRAILNSYHQAHAKQQ